MAPKVFIASPSAPALHWEMTLTRGSAWAIADRASPQEMHKAIDSLLNMIPFQWKLLGCLRVREPFLLIVSVGALVRTDRTQHGHCRRVLTILSTVSPTM